MLNTGVKTLVRALVSVVTKPGRLIALTTPVSEPATPDTIWFTEVTSEVTGGKADVTTFVALLIRFVTV